jgi:hypothetical protein
VVGFRLDQAVARLQAWRTEDGDERLAWDERSDAFHSVRRGARRIEVWCRKPGRKARRALMRAVREVAIGHAGQSRGLILHASCIDSGAGAIAFAGPKGCGKTTLLIAALTGTTCAFLANDRLFVDLSEEPPRAVSLPGIVSVSTSTVGLSPALAGKLDGTSWDPWLRWEDLLGRPVPPAARSGKSHRVLSPFQFRRWLDCAASGTAPMRLLVLPCVETGRSVSQSRRLSYDEVEQRLGAVLFAAGARARSELFALDRGRSSADQGSTAEQDALRARFASRVPVVELRLPYGRVDAATWLPDLMQYVAARP